jgi:uncharacterized membrane protein YozB (DUF420 family)
MISYADLPHINALLNATSAIFLMLGYASIRAKRVRLHRTFMISALTASALFLTSYLIYHAHAGSVRFPGRGWIRSIYFTILISHTILATAVLPLVIITLRMALKRRFERHAGFARWTFPTWLYVSITGVAVYLMLYH